MGSKCFSGCLQCTTVSFWSVSWNTSRKYGRYASVLHVFLEIFPKALLTDTDHCVFKGSSVRHILRPVPSQTSSCSNALPLLAQPEASWCHQWVQRPAVHRWDVWLISPNHCFQMVRFNEQSQSNNISTYFWHLSIVVYMLKHIWIKSYVGTYLYCELCVQLY